MFHFRKMLGVFLVCALTVSSLCIPITAASPNESFSEFTFNNERMTVVIYDKDGNIVPVPYFDYGPQVMKNGQTARFFNEDGISYYLSKGTKIVFTVSFAALTTYEMGYQRADLSYDTLIKSVTTPKLGGGEVITIPQSGYYNFWVKNTGTNTVTLNGARVNTAL